MATNGSSTVFDKIFSRLCARLGEAGNVDIISKEFMRLGDDYERIKFLLSLKLVREVVRIPMQFDTVGSKSDKRSIELREEGNSAFRSKRYDEALLQYTASIAYAQVGRKPEMGTKNVQTTYNGDEFCDKNRTEVWRNTNKSNLQNLNTGPYVDENKNEDESQECAALAYANRSAVLFHLGEYESCIADITEALNLGYPLSLQYKLHDREAHCLMKLPARSAGSAEKSLKAARAALAFSDLDASKRIRFEREIAKAEAQCKNGGSVSDISLLKASLSPQRIPRIDTTSAAPMPPCLTDNQINPLFPSLSSCADVVHKEGRGRFIVATRNVHPGEIILIEQPYASVLMRERCYDHCNRCYRFMLAPVPCARCPYVVYCGLECRTADAVVHETECLSGLPEILRSSGVDKFAFLAVRAVMTKPLSELIDLRSCNLPCRDGETKLQNTETVDTSINESSGAILDSQSTESGTTVSSSCDVSQPADQTATSDGSSCCSSSLSSTTRSSSGPDGSILSSCAISSSSSSVVYKSCDYRRICNLVTHSEQRSAHDLFRRGIIAVYLLDSLQVTDYFKNARLKNQNGDVDDEILAHIGGLLLSHLQSFPCNAHEISELSIDPSSVAQSQAREIGAGIYATLSLFNHSCDPAVTRHFYNNTCVVRAIRAVRSGEELSDNYGAVYAMQSRAERRAKLAPQYYFQCACEACVNDWPGFAEIVSRAPIWRCARCYHGSVTVAGVCRACSTQDDVAGKLKRLKESHKVYAAAFERLLRGDATSALTDLLNHLAVVEDLCCGPCSERSSCQEAVKQCYAILANCYVERADTVGS